MPSVQSQCADFVLRRVVKSAARKRVPSVAAIRFGMESFGRLYPAHGSVKVERVRIGRSPLKAEWVRPRGGVLSRTILFLHGGGYFFGSPRTHRPITTTLSHLAAAQTLSLNYRLAPEHPYPAALDDAVAAYRWLIGRGIPPSEIVLAGDSAGGGLVLSTLMSLRDRGLALPAAAVCFSPWTDLAGTGESMQRNDHRCSMFTAEAVREMARHYLNGLDPRFPLASPLYGDLRGLPPLLLHVSDSEVLLDDALRVAEKARRQQVDVLLNVWPRQPHVWQIFAGWVPEANRSLAQAADFIAWHVPRTSRFTAGPGFALP